MSWTVVGLAAASAVLHVVWNLMVRRQRGSLRFVWILTLAGGAAGAVAALLLHDSLGFGRVWPYLAATIGVHVLYFIGVARSFGDGTLSDVYPMTRGGGILGTALLAGPLLHQRLNGPTIAGILLVAVLVMQPARFARWSRSTLAWGILVALTIAIYSTIDSRGVHLTSPLVYVACQFLGAGILMTPWALRDRAPMPVAIPWSVVAGVISIASYLLILFAYQRAPAAPVLALRQMSTVLAPLAGWLILREPIRRRTLGIALGILGGSILIVLG